MIKKYDTYSFACSFMPKGLFTIILLFTFVQSFAQIRTTGSKTPDPLALRQVSGIVKDSTGQTVIGAYVTLTSSADTIKTSTNDDGIFVFRSVKSWVFSLKVSSLGYITKVIEGKYNDATARLTLDPIILKSDSKMLDAVVVNGTPSIVYKTDTTEYKASDYVVRAGATVDELLQKMEGMEVGNDGSVSVNGEAIVKARLNGKDIYGGDVATTIQNLPAEIVDKVQVIDDYGNTAARTGVKEGDPTKVLNITTRTDKSVGNMARLNFGAGTENQLEASANITRINKNQTLTLNGTFMQTPNGIAGGNSSVGRLGGASNRGGRSGSRGSSGGGGSSSGYGGVNTRVQPAFTYRDKFGKKVEFLANYSFNYNDNNILNSGTSIRYNIIKRDDGTRDTVITNAINSSENTSYSKNHRLNFELEYNIDSANFLQFRPEINFSNSNSNSFSDIQQNGYVNQDQLNKGRNSSTTPNFSGTIAYQHIWLNKPGRTFSLEATFGRNKNDNEANQYNNITYYYDNTSTDSLVNRRIITDNLQKSYRASATYSEPLTSKTRLEFNSNIERRGYDNSRITANLDSLNQPEIIPSLSNIYNYFFTQYRNSVNYRYGNYSDKYSFSLGVTAVNTGLLGEKVSSGTSTDQTYFKLIPIARFQVRWSSTHRLSVNYSGRASEPSFDQIQPVRDVSNPQHPIVGNPNLKVAFNHSINAQYNNYIANSKFNYSVGARTSFTEDQVVSNTVLVDDAYGSVKNETRYININGNNSQGIDYSVSKQLNDRKYNLSFSGNYDRNTRVSMSNGDISKSVTNGFKNSIGPRINPTDWLEVNPYISFDYNKTEYSLRPENGIEQKIWALSLDGNIYFLKNMQFGYALSKNYVSGIANNLTKNPFIINAMLQMKVFKNKGALQFRAYDILKQNNFVNRTTTDTYISETLTNPNSRYFMVNLSMNLQKWTGAMGKGGKSPMRRGDGSFMN